MLIFGGYLKVGESLYTYVVLKVNTILNCLNTGAILPSCEGSCMVYRPEWFSKIQILSNICSLVILKKKTAWYQSNIGSNQCLKYTIFFTLIKKIMIPL